MPEPNFLSWVRQRHLNAAAYHPPRPESSFKGPVNAMLHRYFESEKNWLIVPEILLRDVIEDKDKEPTPDQPNSDENDEAEQQRSEELLDSINEELGYDALKNETLQEDAGNVSLDSQGGVVQGSRIDALRPDFGVSYGRSQLFSDRTHLYVEVKNGSVPPGKHSVQILDYAEAIAKSIPSDFTKDVVLMLVDAGWTYVWRITHRCHLNQNNLFSRQNVRVGKTCGRMMGNVFQELSERV